MGQLNKEVTLLVKTKSRRKVKVWRVIRKTMACWGTSEAYRIIGIWVKRRTWEVLRPERLS